MSRNFLMGDAIFQKNLGTISRLEDAKNNQAEINQLWTEIKSMFLNEMNCLPNLPTSNSSKLNKNRLKSKHFWNEDLAIQWKNTCQAEKDYTSFKVKIRSDYIIKRNLRERYKNCQKIFNKTFRFYKRKSKK